MSELTPYFNSSEAKLEFHMKVRKALIQEVLGCSETDEVNMADVLNNMVFAVDEVFGQIE